VESTILLVGLPYEYGRAGRGEGSLPGKYSSVARRLCAVSMDGRRVELLAEAALGKDIEKVELEAVIQ
jgi:hypothetical protein